MHPKYQAAIKLRKRGKSYREIAKTLNVSKNAVSRWCKNLKLSLSAQRILEKKSNYPKELFRKYNQLKARKVQIENQKIERKFSREIRSPSKDVNTAIEFWAKMTKLSKERFHIVRQISRASQGKRPFNLLPYGTLDVRFSGRQKFYQIRG